MRIRDLTQLEIFMVAKTYYNKKYRVSADFIYTPWSVSLWSDDNVNDTDEGGHKQYLGLKKKHEKKASVFFAMQYYFVVKNGLGQHTPFLMKTHYDCTISNTYQHSGQGIKAHYRVNKGFKSIIHFSWACTLYLTSPGPIPIKHLGENMKLLYGKTVAQQNQRKLQILKIVVGCRFNSVEVYIHCFQI